VSGISAAGLAAGITTGIDTIKINIQLTDDKRISGWQLMKQLVEKNGVAFLWRGSFASPPLFAFDRLFHDSPNCIKNLVC
jgi:hypothetical protein